MRSLTIPSSDEALRALYRTEIAVSGRSKFEDTPQDRIISILSLTIGLISFFYYFNDSMGMELAVEITKLDIAPFLQHESQVKCQPSAGGIPGKLIGLDS